MIAIGEERQIHASRRRRKKKKVHGTHLVDGGGGERTDRILQAEHTPVP